MAAFGSGPITGPAATRICVRVPAARCSSPLAHEGTQHRRDEQLVLAG